MLYSAPGVYELWLSLGPGASTTVELDLREPRDRKITVTLRRSAATAPAPVSNARVRIRSRGHPVRGAMLCALYVGRGSSQANVAVRRGCPVPMLLRHSPPQPVDEQGTVFARTWLTHGPLLVLLS